MRTYKLKISDYRYPNEVPVMIGTIIVSAIVLLLVFVLNFVIGMLFFVSILLFFLNLYQAQLTMIGQCVKVSGKQFPKVYYIAQNAADRLDMDMPPVYIMQNPVMNAFASGFWGNYFVVVYSSVVEALNDEELTSVLGHEFTHIKGNHVIISSITEMGFQTGLKVILILQWVQVVLKYVFLYLSRCFEYTSDRGGLIACGNIQSVITENAKFAVGKDLFNKINIMEFYKQALELDKKPFGILGEIAADHPLTVNRIRQAVRFYRSDTYRKIAAMQGKMGTSTLQGSLATGDLVEKIISKPQEQHQYGSGLSQPNSGYCVKCGTPKKAGSLFCTICGQPYQQPQNTVDDSIPIIAVEEDNLAAASSEVKGYTAMKVCQECGMANSNDADFCIECGNRLMD